MNKLTHSTPLSTYALISVHGDPTAKLGKEGAGGQNIYVRELGLGLARRGCQVDIFTRREDPNQPEIEVLAPGCRTVRLAAGPAEFIPRNQLFAHLPDFVDAWLDFQKRGDRSYSLIHTNYWLSGWVGLQLKFQLGLPQVHTYHSLAAIKYGNVENLSPLAAIRHGVEWACLEQTHCVVATSPQEAAYLRQLVSEYGRIKIIPCGINADHFGSFSRSEARQKLGIAPDKRLILYVGRFDPRKGIETLIRACAQLSQPWQLYLVGGSQDVGADYQEQQRLRRLVEALNFEAGTVIFTGPIGQEDLPPYYAAADVCAVPSYYEPFGLVAIEAMAAGTPVVASAVGGLCHTVLPQKTGLLVPPSNPLALAEALKEILAHPERSRDWGEAGRTWVRSQFSSEAVAAQMYDLYRFLLQAPAISPPHNRRDKAKIPLKKGEGSRAFQH